MLENDALMEWLRVQMLRLRSFDWGQGSWTANWLKDGVAKFGANYSIKGLCTELCVTEDEILTFIDSPAALKELASKSFTASWTGSGLTLSWLYEGIREMKTNISVEYFEKDGAYFVSSRRVKKIVYLDAIERTVSDSGTLGPGEITEEEFQSERKRIESQHAR